MKSKRTLMLTIVLVLAAASMLVAAGTSLTVTGTADTSHYCTDGLITIAYTVSSTAAADAAVVSYTLDGGDTPVTVTTIAAGNITDGGGWTFSGRNKTFSSTFDVSGLAPGNHTITVCADQNGIGPDGAKHDCTDITFFIATCAAADKCDRVGEVFGQVQGNKNLCKSNGTINFQFKGNFGPDALLTVTGPSPLTNVVHTEDVPRDGDSCTYTGHWQAPATSGVSTPGTYTFTVTNTTNSNTIVDTEQLTCSAH